MTSIKIKRMYILSFLFSLHIALSAYVNSTFLTKFFSEQHVGLLYTAASLVTLILLWKNAGILKRFGNRRLILWLLLINMLSLVGMIASQNPYIVGISFIALGATNTLVLFCIDIFIEHFGDPNAVGKTHSIYLTFINLAWAISPLITALLMTREGGYQAIYLLSFVFTIIMTIGLVFSVKTFEDKKYTRIPFIESYRYLKANRHMLAIVIINFLLQFFYSWMVIYTPIYLYKHIGLGWDQIGVIFTIMLSPFVIFGLPVGILIDKYHVKKRTLLYIGFIIATISTFLISGITTQNIALWAIVLFMTRVGATIIETTSETYFFTHVREEEAYLLGIFRDMSSLSSIVAPLFATVVFLFLPFKYLFVVLSIILLSGVYYVSQLKHNHELNISNQNQ